MTALGRQPIVLNVALSHKHLPAGCRAEPGQLRVLLLPRMEAWACRELDSQPDPLSSEPSLVAHIGGLTDGGVVTQREASEAWGACVHLIQEVGSLTAWLPLTFCRPAVPAAEAQRQACCTVDLTFSDVLALATGTKL